MSNILMSAGSGGYIAGLVIELLIIAAAGVFIFLTLSGKLSKKAIAAGGDAPSEEEAAEEMLIQENVEPAAEAAGETELRAEPLMAEEVPIPEKKAKKSKKAEGVEAAEAEAAPKVAEAEAAPKAAEAEAAPKAAEAEEYEAKPEKKEPVKRKIKIRLNIKGTDGSDILSQDVTPTDNGGEEEAKIDLNVDDLTRKADKLGITYDESAAEEAAADAADAEKEEQEPAKPKKPRKKK